MEPVWWIFAMLSCGIMTGGLVYFVMQSRMEVRLSRQREELAAAKASLSAQKRALRDSIHAVEESARMRAINEFLADIHIEERHYIREQKALFMNKKSVVRQERIFFRSLPLSNWIEQEMPYQEGMDLEQLASTMAVFAPGDLIEESEVRPRKMLTR
jgi:hypothetical protein